MTLSRQLLRSLPSPRLVLQSRTFQHAPKRILTSTRSFSITCRREASEPDLGEMYAKLSKTTVFQKLAESPSAINALKDFGQAMQKQGRRTHCFLSPETDLSLGYDLTKPPTTMQMVKMSMNKEFREAALRMQEEFTKAGIDLADKAVMEELMQAMKKD
ncbi:hypothetical protein VNI00_005722 [Paramarasmius palmivorus]|uniref:Uncharacterized protein n=1 Tax=Paramarasmius palmivorus TaxID=297713 RepID=A0AAW0DBA0_9AGAR